MLPLPLKWKTATFAKSEVPFVTAKAEVDGVPYRVGYVKSRPRLMMSMHRLRSASDIATCASLVSSGQISNNAAMVLSQI